MTLSGEEESGGTPRRVGLLAVGLSASAVTLHLGRTTGGVLRGCSGRAGQRGGVSVVAHRRARHHVGDHGC
jgi:hypothetical protein